MTTLCAVLGAAFVFAGTWVWGLRVGYRLGREEERDRHDRVASVSRWMRSADERRAV